MIDAAPYVYKRALMPLFLMGSLVGLAVSILLYLNVGGHGHSTLVLSALPRHTFNLSSLLADRIVTIAIFVMRFFVNYWRRPNDMSIIEGMTVDQGLGLIET